MSYTTYSQEYDPIHPPNAITDNLPLEKQSVIFLLFRP